MASGTFVPPSDAESTKMHVKQSAASRGQPRGRSARREFGREDRGGFGGVAHHAQRIGEALVGAQVRLADELAHLGPVLGGLQAAQRDLYHSHGNYQIDPVQNVLCSFETSWRL